MGIKKMSDVASRVFFANETPAAFIQRPVLFCVFPVPYNDPSFFCKGRPAALAFKGKPRPRHLLQKTLE